MDLKKLSRSLVQDVEKVIKPLEKGVHGLGSTAQKVAKAAEAGWRGFP